jgi:hypothetical protein
MRYSKFLTTCDCGNQTSKSYARAHNGQCKRCAEPNAVIRARGLRCPTCGEMTLTAYQKAHRYHCDNCTRETDPEGYRREVMGLNDSDGDNPYND